MRSDPNASTEQPHSAVGGLPSTATLGRFELGRLIGRGAFGSVYQARDPELDRDIALKVGSGRGQSYDDFLEEGRALGRLVHPNIVRVYEVGRDDAIFYVVMELVRGTTLTQWCDANRHWRAISTVFLQVARGLAEVHEAGLVHRDVKPDNILIDDTGRAVIVDFGLASIDHDSVSSLAGSSMSSSPHSRVAAGTPRYMAPELFVDGARATFASDQFACCVAFHRALVGEFPYRGDTLAELLDETRRGRIFVQKHGRGLPRWLSAILGRGLAPDPASRWPSIRDMAMAIERGLGRRRRFTLLGTVAASAMAAAGFGWYFGNSRRDERCTGADAALADTWNAETHASAHQAFIATALPYAADAWRNVEIQIDHYTSEWKRAHADACRASAVRGEQSATVMDRRMRCLDGAERSLRATVAVLASADAAIVERAHDLMERLPKLSRCADPSLLDARFAGLSSAEMQVVERVEERIAEAEVLRTAADYEDALRAVEAARAMLDETPHDASLSSVSFEQAAILDDQGRFEEAEARLEDALRWAVLADRVDLTAQATIGLIRTAGVERNQPDAGRAYAQMGTALVQRVGDLELDAELNFALGHLSQSHGQFEEARTFFQTAFESAMELHGPDDIELARFMGTLAGMELQTGRFGEARRLNERTKEIIEKHLGHQHPDLAIVLNNIGTMYLLMGEPESAKPYLERSIGIEESAFGPKYFGIANSLANLASVEYSRGDHRTAIGLLERALILNEEAFGADHPEVAKVLVNLATIAFEAQRYPQARAANERAVAILESRDPSDPDLAAPLAGLAEIALLEGRNAEARSLAERVLGFAATEGMGTADGTAARFVLAQVLWPSDPTRARALAEGVLAEPGAADPTEAAFVARVRTWLASHPAPTERRAPRSKRQR